MSKLKPCPFCGTEVNGYQHRNDFDSYKKTHVSISCDNCEVLMVANNTKSITKKWNRRHE